MTRLREIASANNPWLVRLRKLLARPDAYRRIGSVWIEGEHLCATWLARRGGAGVHAVIGQSAWEKPVARDLASEAEAVTLLPDALMAALSPLETPSTLAFTAPWPGAGQVRAARPTIVLDRIQDAGNVGTLLRSAAAFGFAQAVALKGTAALWSPKVMRAGMGAHLALQLVEGASEEDLGALELPLLATSSHTGAALPVAPLPWPCAWVFGHEGQGVSSTLMRRCAQALRIPQPGGEESLNVGVAASICLYESARRRLTPG